MKLKSSDKLNLDTASYNFSVLLCKIGGGRVVILLDDLEHEYTFAGQGDFELQSDGRWPYPVSHHCG